MTALAPSLCDPMVDRPRGSRPMAERLAEARRLRDAAAVLQSHHQLDEAEALARLTMARLGEEGWADVAEVAELCSGVAWLLDGAGARAEAEGLHRRAALILVASPAGGAHDRQRVCCGTGLATNLRAQGRHQEAIGVFAATVALAEQLLGPDDLDTLAAIVGLATMCAQLGEHQEAEALYRQALARAHEAWPQRPERAGIEAALGLLLVAQGRTDEAELLFRRAGKPTSG